VGSGVALIGCGVASGRVEVGGGDGVTDRHPINARMRTSPTGNPQASRYDPVNKANGVPNDLRSLNIISHPEMELCLLSVLSTRDEALRLS